MPAMSVGCGMARVCPFGSRCGSLDIGALSVCQQEFCSGEWLGVETGDVGNSSACFALLEAEMGDVGNSSTLAALACFS